MRCNMFIFHILYIILAPLCSAFLKLFYKAPRSEKRSVLWLASYPVRCDWPNTSRPSPYCDAVFQHDDIKTIKPIINEAFVASSGDIHWPKLWTKHFCFCPHFSWAELKDLRLFLCTQKAYLSQILFTNLSKSVLVSTSPLPR